MSQEVEPIQCPHSLCRGLYVAVDNMRLASHALGLERDDIEDWPVG